MPLSTTPAHPAVIKLIASVARFGRDNNIPVSLCGDMASEPAHLGALLAAGLTSLSVAPARIGRVKRRWRSCEMANPQPRNTLEPVSAYKQLLATIIDRRPSGTRQRLASALAKNRSFVSQITNPAYATPIPAAHLEIIFELCHFSAPEKRQFMDLYHAAHPRRLTLLEVRSRLKPHTVYLPDLGDETATRNCRFLSPTSCASWPG